MRRVLEILEDEIISATVLEAVHLLVDDIGAVAIIAVFYTANIKLAWLIGSLAVLSIMLAMNRMRVDRIWPYVLMAVILWYCVLNSGVHATIAGVVAALMVLGLVAGLAPSAGAEPRCAPARKIALC